MVKTLAGATTVGNLAGAFAARSVNADEAAIVGELCAGSEDAYSWLIAHYQQPVYSMVYRILNDPSDAADTTQEVFLKVFRGIKRFNGDSSLKTWIYRIAIHEASNQRRWWFRHKRKETSMETPTDAARGNHEGLRLEDTLVDQNESPYTMAIHEEVRAKVEAELKQVPEPYRTAVILRDIEGMSYEEIAEILEVSLGTVKSRLMRGREALRKRLVPYVQQTGTELGLDAAGQSTNKSPNKKKTRLVTEILEVEAEIRR